ncbi:MAG: hypothetical protein Q3988_05585 [Gemella sp.]|nr:hypothetical protein [Gemella sp.]
MYITYVNVGDGGTIVVPCSQIEIQRAILNSKNSKGYVEEFEELSSIHIEDIQELTEIQIIPLNEKRTVEVQGDFKVEVRDSLQKIVTIGEKELNKLRSIVEPYLEQ